MSDESEKILFITSFLESLGEKLEIVKFRQVHSVKGSRVETYKISASLEITVAGLEGEAKRLMVSRHPGSISQPIMSK
jgi:hypothetical protein